MSSEKKVSVTLTARDGGYRLAPLAAPAWEAQPEHCLGLPAVCVNPQVAYQEIEGFGGAFTEAAAVTLLKMPSEIQEAILRSYFCPETGHAYSLCRTHINSCDFSLGNYAYCEKDGDFELTSFSIERDRQALLPMIRRAQALAGGRLKLLASPWSPPAWMKTNGRMNEGGSLKPECRGAWARYYVRYLREYEKEGVPVWGFTVQNEPMASPRWDSCLYTAEEERDFVRDHLGPTLHREGLAHVKLLVWDHNRHGLYDRISVIYEDPEAARYVWGSAFHWYEADVFENVQRAHDAWPGKKLLFTEGCQEGGPHHGSWLIGERYARSLLNDLNHWTVGWVDWNLLLDETGGPNHVGNLCSAPILCDTRTGEVHYQSSYYYLGHFARFIKPGARRILCLSGHDHLECTACRNPDGRVAVVVLNRSEDPLIFLLKSGREGVKLEAPRRSILTTLIS